MERGFHCDFQSSLVISNRSCCRGNREWNLDYERDCEGDLGRTIEDSLLLGHGEICIVDSLIVEQIRIPDAHCPTADWPTEVESKGATASTRPTRPPASPNLTTQCINLPTNARIRDAVTRPRIETPPEPQNDAPKLQRARGAVVGGMSWSILGFNCLD